MYHVDCADELMFLQKPPLRDFFIPNFFPWASQSTSWLRVAKFLVPLFGARLKSRQPWPRLSRTDIRHREEGPGAVTLPSEPLEATVCLGGLSAAGAGPPSKPFLGSPSRTPGSWGLSACV